MTRRQLLLASALATAGCNRNRPKLIAVIPKSVADLFFITVHSGAERAARDSKIDIAWNGPDFETDYGRQIQIVDAMISRHVDGIAISGTDDRALADPLERAIAAGIPVSVYDSGVNIENYVSFIATDNFGAGCTAARSLGRMFTGPARIAMMMQKPGGKSTELRERGFEETMAKEFPGITIAARQYCMGDRLKAMGIAENILASQPELGGIFCSSEAGSLGSIRALRSHGLAGKIRLITFDVSDVHIEALRDGTTDIMMVQDAFRLGYQAVKSLVDHLAGRTPVKRLDIPVRLVTSADLDKPEIRELLKPPQTAKGWQPVAEVLLATRRSSGPIGTRRASPPGLPRHRATGVVAPPIECGGTPRIRPCGARNAAHATSATAAGGGLH